MLGGKPDQVDVGTFATIHAVNPGQAVQDVDAATALDPVSVGCPSEDVGTIVTDQGDGLGQRRRINIEGSRAGGVRHSVSACTKHHLLDAPVTRKQLQRAGTAGRKPHLVDTRAAAIGDFCGRMLGSSPDQVNVGALATVHGVDTGLAIQHVVSAVAGNDVGQRVAGPHEVGGALQLQVLDVGRHSPGSRCTHQIRATRGTAFSHDIAAVVNQVDIVTTPTEHLVGTSATIKQIIAQPGIQRIVAAKAIEPVDT